MDTRYALVAVCLLGLASFTAIATRAPGTGTGPLRDHLLAVALGGLLAIVCALGLTGLWFTSWRRHSERQ